MFRMSGIFRDVYLWSAGALDLKDFWIKAGLADDYQTGTLAFSAEIANHGAAETTATATLTLTSPDGKLIAVPPVTVKIPAKQSAEQSVSLDPIPNVKSWSPITPGRPGFAVMRSKTGSSFTTAGRS